LRRTPFRIGAYTVEPQRNTLIGPPGAVSLEPKVMDLLCVLAERGGEVYSRAELIDRVWGVEFGGDESLTRAVSQLRKAFGDARDEAHTIETIPKRGYRLVAPVSLEAEPAVENAPAAPSGLRPDAGSWLVAGAILVLACIVVAVWVFRSLQPVQTPAAPAAESGAVEGIAVAIRQFASLDQGRPEVARALTEDIAAALSRVKLLRVSSGSRAEVPAELRFALDGNVQRSGDRVRVNVQITDLSSGLRVWSQDYERGYDGSLEARDALSTMIAGEVYPQLILAAQATLKRRSIFSLAPWELTLLATWTPGGTEVFLAPHNEDRDWLQRRALALDPKYAPAHASLAQFLAYTALFNPAWDGEALHEEIARHAALAIAYAPFDPDVLFQIATYERLEGERGPAVATLKRVLAIQPTHQIARIDLPFVESLCQTDEAPGERALKAILTDLSVGDASRSVVLSHLADLYLAGGAYAEARAAADQSRRIVRTTWSSITFAAASAALGRRDDAVEAVRLARQEWPNLDFDVFADRVVARWCLKGPRADAVRGIFHRLAKVEKTK